MSPESLEYPKTKILLGLTGSVATIKVNELIQNLQSPPLSASIRIVVTEAAKSFFSSQTSQECSTSGNDLPQFDSDVLTPDGNGIPIYDDKMEFSVWKKRGDPVMHIDLMEWADMLVIAPLSANTLHKMSTGECNNLLSCIIRAWPTPSMLISRWKEQRKTDENLPFLHKPIVLAPAMNTNMLLHPATGNDLTTLHNWYNSDYDVVGMPLLPGILLAPPVSKILMCGAMGIGAMASPSDIAELCLEGVNFLRLDLSDTIERKEKRERLLKELRLRNEASFRDLGAKILCNYKL